MLSRPDLQAAQAPQVTKGLTALHDARRFMTKYQWCGAAFVMAEKCMHVRAADANAFNPDNHLAVARNGVGNICIFERLWPAVNKCLHLDVNPPSIMIV